jgi:hypothetical protein
MEIVDNKGAPPELIRIAHKAAGECKKVKRIIFDAFIDDLKGDLGAYDPVTETIIIDMGACVMKQAWMKKGILYIPNVWFNLVFTFFHEMEHAFQLEEDPELLKLDSLPQQYEDEANITAEASLLEWAKDGIIPRLNEMGWVGNEIKTMLNRLYAIEPDQVSDELDIEGTEAVANALHASLVSKQYENKEEMAELFDSIDKGYVGTKVKGKRYFTAYDAINTTYEGH